LRYFLYGDHELSIDDKNRMLIPSEIRKQLDPERDGDAFFLVPGTDRRPWLYPERWYQELVGQQRSELTPDEDTLAYDRMTLGMASRIEWDKQGRVLLPEKFIKRAGLGKEVTLVGARDHLELWPREAWEKEWQMLDTRWGENVRRARQARQSTPPAQS
jgi:MraZ protein